MVDRGSRMMKLWPELEWFGRDLWYLCCNFAHSEGLGDNSRLIKLSIISDMAQLYRQPSVIIPVCLGKLPTYSALHNLRDAQGW